MTEATCNRIFVNTERKPVDGVQNHSKTLRKQAAITGDSFRVLECDADAILIEVLGNPNNPYFVSRQFLATVSDFPADDASAGE